jgi:GNAT superfamily N-acetyltransferase
MADFAIRWADTDDFEAISDVYRRSSLSNEGDRSALLANPDVLVFAVDSIIDGRTRVAVDGGRVMGFATTTVVGEIAELDDLFVDPDWMRRGVARALVHDAASVARAGGCSRIEVTANGHALPFYDAVGFVADGVVTTQFALGTRMHLEIMP